MTTSGEGRWTIVGEISAQHSNDNQSSTTVLAKRGALAAGLDDAVLKL
jgi:hypothetical protein